jgi:PAS domain S-box-containing protein
MKVLIVEDNADSRNLLAKQLSAYGHEVIAAVDGVDALEKAQKSLPDILVSDILMPRMDGYKLCYEWKQHKQLKDIPFVFYTAIYTSGKDEKFGLSLGANLFIRKPLEPEALAKILSQVFEQAKEGLLPTAKAPPEPSLYLTEYNERLVTKLNEKVAELETSEDELRYLSSILRAIRSINQLIVRERDKTKLLKGACRILYKVREYRFVWIGLIEAGHKRVMPVARAGVKDSFLDKVEITWDDKPSGQRPAGTAIKTKKPDLISNIKETQRPGPWAEALKRGYHSLAAIPLVHDDKVYGVLNVYSSNPDGFDDTEVDLLMEVSGDLAFALGAIERQEARQRAEHDLKERMKELRCLYNIEMIGDKPDLSLDEIYQRVVNELPPGWQYPEVTAATLTLYGKIFETEKYRDSQWKQSADVKVYGEKVGGVEVVYLEEKPESDEGPFLKEERRLINSVAEQLARITEHRSAEEALEKERDRAQKYLDIADVMIIVIGKDKRIQLVNQRGCQILGCKEKEIVGRNWFRECLPKKIRAEVEAGFDMLVAGKVEPMEYNENPVMTKGGKERLIAWHNTVIRDDDGRIVATLSSGQDITESKRAEEALRRSEANLAEAQRVAHIGSWELDIASGKLYWSDEVYRIYGMKPHQIRVTYETFKESIHPDDRELVEKAYTESLKAKTPYNVVHRIRLKGGKVKYVEEMGETFYDDKGKPVRSIGTAQDITERRQAEEALRESEAFQAELLNNSPIAISVINPDTSVRYVNPAMVKLTGFSAEELTGEKAPYCYWAEESMKQTMEGLKEAMRRGSDRVVELFKRKNEERFWVEITSTPVKKDGKLQYLLVNWVDITERKQAEEEISRLAKFPNENPAPVMRIDRDGTILYANKASLPLLNDWKCQVGQILPKYWRGLTSNALRSGSRKDVEVNVGKQILTVILAPVAEEGYVNLYGLDITERKQAEEALRESEARYRAVIEGAHDMIQSVSLDGRIIFVNKAWLDTLGFTEAELSNLNMFDIIHPDYLPHCREMMAGVAEGKTVQSIEATFLTKDGREILVEGNVTPRYIGKKVVASHGIFRDVTERKRAEAALADEATRRRILIDQSSDGIVILDEDGKVYEANRRFAEMLGYTPEEVRKLSVWDWEYQYPREQVAEMIRTVDEAGDHFETRHRRKDGTVFDVEISTNGAIYAGQKLIFCVCRDITARNQAAAALSQSEEKLRVILESIPLGVTVTDLEGKILQVNNASLRVHGYNTREEIIGLGAFELITEEGRARAADNLKTTLETGRSGAVEYTLLRKDGTTYPAQLSAAVVKDESNKPIGFVAVIEDITERKQAEAKLRDEATRRRILIDESSDGIITLDEKGKVYEANKRFAEMLGYTPEEVLKLHIWDFEALRNREQVLEEIKTLGPEGDHFETRHRRKDGTVFDVEVSSNSAVYAGQKLIFSVSRDITERKQAEEALRESEEKYKNLVGATSDIIWETDADGWFTFISPKIKDILGYGVAEVVGKKRTLDLVPKEQFPRWLERFKELNAKKAPVFGLEIPHLHKNGRQVIFETSGIPLLDSAGKLRGYVGINRDITERRQMQEQLVITDRLASVGELAAGIAHELNNPLTGVIGFSQLLLDKEMPDDIKQDVKVVNSEARRASQVVKNLLTFARKHAAAKEQVSINDIINKVLELRAYEQNLENIKVRARLDPELPETMADYFQLQQVFLNIVINAEYFMKEAHHGGELTITTEKVGNKVRASFADDGPGIAKGNQGHLFDPFFTTKEVGKGTGLGLSICHGIVAEHGGRIYVESELGKGATFIVELPIGAAERRKGGAL